MKKLLMMFFVALTVSMQSCDNNDDLWAAIDDLKGRVQALEKNVKDLNGNIDALRELYSGKTITNVAVEGDKYVLTLSDGTKVELKQGSDADAVIPVMGIDKDGFWQVSYDGGKTFESLGVKATANDGKTPQFRIDETTGYWQVRYADTEEYKNVLDTTGKPVKAVGAGSVTDTFFEDVKVVGDVFYIKLHDGTEMNIPILKDFQCVIHTPTEGVQKFNANETKTFQVDIKGADNYIVTAPDGWAASLSTPSGNRATLSVTAPDVVTRATADNTKDVSILITSNSYASISKIQVELAASVSAPTAVVANSTTTLPTASSLSFDVTVTDAEGWKYICQKSSDAAPAAVKVISDGTAGAGSSVTVSGLDANTGYTIYVVAYKGAIDSGVQSVANTTAAAPVTETDFYQDYLDGKTLTIGSVSVNVTNFPTAQMLKPTELTVDIMKAGGLIFVDNSDESALSFTFPGTSLDVARAADLVLVGRYKEKKQAAITVPEFRCNRNITIMNLHVTSSTDNTFTTTNAQSLDPALQLVDCTFTIKRYLIYDNNNIYSFSKVLVDNSLLEFPAGVTNQPSVFAITTTAKAEGRYPHQSIKMTNSVFYGTSGVQASIVNLGNTAQNNTRDLIIEVNNNTFYNIYQPNVLVRAGLAKGVIMTKNVGYADYTSLTNVNSTYLMCVYFTDVDTGVSSVADNYLYSLGKASATKDKAPWILVHSNNKVTVNGQSEMVDGDLGSGNPFLSADVSKGYFPVNTSIVTNGAGASYNTKTWTR